MFNNQTNKKHSIPIVTYSEPSTSIEYSGIDEEDGLQSSLFAPFKEKRDCKGKDAKYQGNVVPKNKNGNTRVHLASECGQIERIKAYFKEFDNFDQVQKLFILMDISRPSAKRKT